MKKRKIKSFWILSGMIITFLLLNFLTEVRAEIKKGSSREEVIATLGEPQGKILSGDEEMLCYPEGFIVITNGQVVNINGNFNFKKSTTSRQKEKKDVRKESKQKVNEPPVKVYNRGGKSIDLKEVLVPGKVTIVDFYADWCGPCRMISPYLESLAKGDPEVFLRKIDIVNWQTPVVKQYNIQSVPNIRVFNRKGRMVGRPTYNFEEVKEYIEKAK